MLLQVLDSVGFCVCVSLCPEFVVDLRSQCVLMSPPSMQIARGQRTVAKTTDYGPGIIRSKKHLSYLKNGGDYVIHAQRPRVQQVSVSSSDFSSSVLCPRLKSLPLPGGPQPMLTPTGSYSCQFRDQLLALPSLYSIKAGSRPLPFQHVTSPWLAPPSYLQFSENG